MLLAVQFWNLQPWLDEERLRKPMQQICDYMLKAAWEQETADIASLKPKETKL